MQQPTGIKAWILRNIVGIKDPIFNATDMAGQYREGFDTGKKFAKIHFAVLPLPFTPEQLEGKHYGEFITPHGFAASFDGECTIPAPGKHGYEQRAYYISKDDLNNSAASYLMCHSPHKFDRPSDSEALLPVIVTVLR
jgi:hypothetical protein